jgi:hypothetical protein
MFRCAALAVADLAQMRKLKPLSHDVLEQRSEEIAVPVPPPAPLFVKPSDQIDDFLVSALQVVLEIALGGKGRAGLGRPDLPGGR